MTPREDKWIKNWKNAHAFEPSRVTSEPKFFLTVPYAYPTGPLHVGHGRTYVNGDVIARFKRIQGKNVLWPMGFHVTGTPVLAICDALKRKDPEMLKLYTDYLGIYEKDPHRVQEILLSFEKPENVAQYFASHIREDLEKFGIAIDWRAEFSTMDPEYQKFIHWQFRKLKEKGALVKGKYPILYSSVDKNAVGEDDIKDGDTDKVTIQEFELIKFKLAGQTTSTYFVASTLRPETIHGLTNLWVNPNVQYCRVHTDHQMWIVSSASIEKLRQQGEDIVSVEDVDVRPYLGKSVENPLEPGKTVPILEAPFVSGERGTGVVYSVPGHAPWDYMALQEAKQNQPAAKAIVPVHIIDTPGLESIEALLEKHKAKSLQHREGLQAATEEIYKKEFYEGKMNAQNGSLSGMSVQKAKDTVLQTLASKGLATKLYEPSRRAQTRAGNPVSVALLEDQWFLDYSSPEWKKKTHALLDRMPVYPEHFKNALRDAIDWLGKRPCIRKRGLGTSFPFAEEWMIEPLSDSTIYMIFYLAVPHIRSANVKLEQLDDAFFDAALLGRRLPDNDTRAQLAQHIFEQVQYWYPNDLRHTAPAHISNHISFYLFTHTLLFEEKYWPGSLTFNEMLVRNGVKMSKSKGNVIPLQHAIRDNSADLVRLFILSSAGFDRVADWKDNQVPQVKSKLNELEQTFLRALSTHETTLTLEQEWLAQNLRAKLGTAYDAYNTYDFMGAAQKVFFETLNEIKRFRKVFGGDDAPAVKHVLREWLILASPITPFMAEEMGEKMKIKGFVSLQTLAKPEGRPDADVEARAVFLEGVMQDMDRVRKLVKGKQPKAVFIYSTDQNETLWLRGAMNALETFSKLQVKINDAHDPLGKMQKAQKGRPALYME